MPTYEILISNCVHYFISALKQKKNFFFFFPKYSDDSMLLKYYFSKREEIALKFECILPCKSIYDSFARTVPDRKFTHKCDRFKRIVGELQTLSSSWINNLSMLFPCNMQWEEREWKTCKGITLSIENWKFIVQM